MLQLRVGWVVFVNGGGRSNVSLVAAGVLGDQDVAFDMSDLVLKELTKNVLGPSVIHLQSIFYIVHEELLFLVILVKIEAGGLNLNKDLAFLEKS